MRFDDHPGEADRMDKFQQWALPASIAFAGACVLGAGVLVSMPLNALKGIEASASGVVGENQNGVKYIRLIGEFSNNLKGGEYVGQFAN